MDEVKRLLFVDNCDNRPKIIDALACGGWTVEHVDDLRQAAVYVREQSCDVGIIPLNCANLPKQSEVERLFADSNIEWVALTDKPALNDSRVCQLLGNMFFAYHLLPGHSQQLDVLLSHACAMSRLLQTDATAGKPRSSDEYEMVGATIVMRQLFQSIRKVAAVDAPVLITGESGTGKELTARSIHERSSRAKGVFNAVNCAALPSNLIQSELFGHEKGSFTGATQRKIGRIESTAGGTLFLDEIGDLPMDMQVNLLRFLEGHFIQRVGSVTEIPVDVRVIAATHVDLEKAVREGRFREDLYHRLNVLQVRVPALRERPEDIELLAKFFFQKFLSEKNIKVHGFSLEAMAVMRQHSWPGNVRELINRTRRAMVMSEGRLIKPEDLGIERRGPMRSIVTLEEARCYAEQRAVHAAMIRNNHNIQQAAAELGVSRVTLYRLLEKYKQPASGSSGAAIALQQYAGVIENKQAVS